MTTPRYSSSHVSKEVHSVLRALAALVAAGTLIALIWHGVAMAEPNRQPAEQPAIWAALHYKEFESLTPLPVAVDPALLIRCTSMKQADFDQLIAKDGPHAHWFGKVSIFMNPTAAHAFHAKEQAYPIGSIIVKEKTTPLMRKLT